MQTLSNNKYNHAADIELLEDSFNNKTYLEDMAGYSKNLLIVLKKITDDKNITTYIKNKVETVSLSTVSYMYLKDIVKMLETSEVINISKYKDVLFGKVGKIQEPIVINNSKNIETEFVILLSKLDMNGMIEFIKTLSYFNNESIKG